MTQYSFLRLIGCAYSSSMHQHSVYRHQQHSFTVAKMEPVFTMIMIRGLLLLGTQEGNKSTLSQRFCPPQRHYCCTGKGAYFKQHASAFCVPTPAALFHSSKDGTCVYNDHDTWLATIRNTGRQQINTESKILPSTEALLLHWKRCEWVLRMWKCATSRRLDSPGIIMAYSVCIVCQK